VCYKGIVIPFSCFELLVGLISFGSLVFFYVYKGFASDLRARSLLVRLISKLFVFQIILMNIFQATGLLGKYSFHLSNDVFDGSC